MKAAEADADSKYLSGVGIARQRKAIVEGLRDSVMHFSESVEGTNAKDVMDLVLVTQYVSFQLSTSLLQDFSIYDLYEYHESESNYVELTLLFYKYHFIK